MVMRIEWSVESWPVESWREEEAFAVADPKSGD